MKALFQPYRIAAIAAACLLPGIAFVPSTSSAQTSTVAMTRAVATEFSAQTRRRPRVRVTPNQPAAYDYPLPGEYAWPGPGYVRHCVDWYATEYRPSGTVITPQMRCRWVRG